MEQKFRGIRVVSQQFSGGCQPQAWRRESPWALCVQEIITTDASESGWGAVWRETQVQGQWNASLRGARINLLEVDAVFRTLIHFLHLLQEKQVMIQSDITTVVSYKNHQGGTHSETPESSKSPVMCIKPWQNPHLNYWTNWDLTPFKTAFLWLFLS